MKIRKFKRRPKAQGLLNNNNIIINWNPLKRCIVILITAIGLNILWALWKSYIFITPSLHPFINLELLHSHFKINLAFIVIFLLLIFPCYRLQHHKIAQAILPPICISIFAMNLCYDGYTIGILSPVTSVVAVGTTTVGLILFDRKLIYIVLLVSLAVLSYLMYETMQGRLLYAPVFNTAAMNNSPFTHPFWAGSMFFFITPIIISCLLLLNTILKQWQAREESFKLMSQIDPLTETMNRRSINQYLLQIEQTSKNKQMQYGIILIDLDFFKKINDTYGHLKGDEVLVKAAHTLKENMRYGDMIGRYGGEEFIIIVENSNSTISHQIAQRCRQALIDLDITSEHGEKIAITASFGVSNLNPNTNVQQALHLADIAMYQAKDAGRNTVIVSI